MHPRSFLIRRLLFIAVLMSGVLAPVRDHARTTDTAAIMQLVREGKSLRDTAPDSAHRVLQRAFRLSSDNGYNHGKAWASLLLGELAMDKADFNRSLALYHQAWRYNSNVPGNELLNTIIVIDAATSFNMKGENERAVGLYLKAAEYAGKIKPRSEGERLLVTIYANITAPLYYTRQYAKALYYLDKAEPLARKNQLHSLLAHVLLNKGSCYKPLKKPEAALAAYQESLQVSQEHGLTDFQQTACNNIGDLLFDEGQDSAAIAYLQRAVSIDKKNHPFYTAGTLSTLGTIYYKLKKYPEAEQNLLAALSYADKHGIREYQVRTHERLAYTYQATGQYRQAFEHLRAFKLLEDSAALKDETRNIQQLETRYRTALKDKEIADKQIQLQRKNNWIIIILGSALLLLVLLYAYFRHRNRLQRRKIRILEQEHEIRSLKAMMEGEEKERIRIAQDLHDGIGGMLTALNMNLGTLQKKHGHLAEIRELQAPINMVQDIAAEVRHTAHNLMPDALLHFSLEEAIQSYCTQINTGGQVQIDFHTWGSTSQLDKSVALSLFRILQEMIRNTVRHAEARQATIQLRQHEDILGIHVEDNGIGFDAEADHAGMGLKNIRARVHALKGYLSVASSSDQGTTIYMEFNLRQLKTLIV